MPDKEAESFVAKVKKHASTLQSDGGVDWDGRRDAWIAATERLMNDIRVWLTLLSADGTASISNRKITITEQYIGSYEASAMTISIAGLPKVTIEPKATLIVGALGRVDVEGPGGYVTLVLTNEDQTVPSKEKIRLGQWRIVGADKIQLIPLSEDTFQKIFLLVSGIEK